MEDTNIIGKDVCVGENLKIGHFCLIDNGVTIGDNVTIGNYVHIQEGCCIGDNTNIEHYVLLKKGTVVGSGCFVDSSFRSSGQNRIGNNCTLRFNSTIAREVVVEDDCFISPNVMTIYSDHKGEKHGGTVIGKGSHIGTNAVLHHNVKVAPRTVVGALSLVNKDISDIGHTYVGIPARKVA